MLAPTNEAIANEPADALAWTPTARPVNWFREAPRRSPESDVRRPDVKAMRTSRLVMSESSTIRHALAQAEQVAPMPSTVLLLGETGVGKELFAQAIHELSPQAQRPMIRVSCAAIPSTLIESELFGHERGAFTGAVIAADRPVRGRQPVHALPRRDRRAARRTSRSSCSASSRNASIERLGSTQPIKVNVRIIAATNRRPRKGGRGWIVP